ncbi:hypothetical protein DEO72_LG9g2371 [Vigna unguiculata]|uniref:Uncharacterized protein n=1 Tax=Vigna unguiculata TaxID=3917 RepID=A0A4D6N341_VIGUN|nr:hypothetical protein DEO72_LG9g2371 [Vigna unguiculata]
MWECLPHQELSSSPSSSPQATTFTGGRHSPTPLPPHVRLRCKELDKIVKGVEERHLCIPVAINRMKGVKERCFFVAVVMNRERGGGDAVLQLRCNGRQ